MAPDTLSGIATAAITAGSLIVSGLSAGGWALYRVCQRLDRMERSLNALLEWHKNQAGGR